MRKETNVFPINNLGSLSANYRLFEIVGLRSTGDEYDANIQYITKKLSFSLRHPVIVIHRDGKPYLVVKDEAEAIGAIPSEGFEAKRGEFAYFKDIEETRYIDFESTDESEKQIILRFLQFDLSGEIRKDDRLWQPRTGDAFFSKEDHSKDGDKVVIYNGFYARIVELPGGGYGVAVDITKKYLAKRSLRARLSLDEFNRLKRQKKKLIYKYGKTWFEIRPDELSPVDISKYKFKRPSDTTSLTLLEDIKQVYNGTMPPHLAKLPDSASVLVYRNRNGDMQSKGAPAAMCYVTFDTEDYEVKKLHRNSIIAPFKRRRLSRMAVKKYFGKLKFGTTPIKFDLEPVTLELDVFKMPDLEFNNDVILGCEHTERANIEVKKREIGEHRKRLLTTDNVGVFTNGIFERQYIVIPESIYNSFANETYFLRDLSAVVDQMHPTDTSWKPIVVPYDDRNEQNALEIGFEIINALGKNISMNNRSYAVVILPSHMQRDKRMHDETAALVVSEALNEYNVMASIMHTKTLEMCFSHRDVNGEAEYFIKHDRDNKFKRLYERYLFGVALNQVLLNNERWPFILAEPLHADLVIGIDVKEHVAGFTFIDKHSKNILTTWDKSQNKEKLTKDQVHRILVQHIKTFAEDATEELKNITFHRDGRIFRSEVDGISEAIRHLKGEGLLAESLEVSIVEIPKSSKISFRIFEVQEEYDVLATFKDNHKVKNPSVGTYVIMNSNEGYVCTTGKEFRRNGTSKPLFVKYFEGAMSFEHIMEDIYRLSCLTYTKPDDCARNPITISMTDRRINLMGSKYDEQKYDLLKTVNN